MTTRKNGTRLECMTCHKRWVTSETRDEFCDSCFNDLVPSGKVTGCQLMEDIPHVIIGWREFAGGLDRAMDAEYRRQKRKS